MEASDDAAVSAVILQHTRCLPPHPQKLWHEAMRCDEILRSEEGDVGHHTQRRLMIRPSKIIHDNGGRIDGAAENGSATASQSRRKD
jgi:hypothetical protein